LFAALEVATGRVSADACFDRHSNVEFLAFLKQVTKAHPRVKLHVVVDNYSTHNHPNVKAWLGCGDCGSNGVSGLTRPAWCRARKVP
jgi:hypothetical protein